jgi:CspA family cold shock protein
MATGIVKFYNEGKGFGFIACDDKKVGDVFVHSTMLSKHEAGVGYLEEGMKVEFEFASGDKGNRVTQLTRVIED